MRQLTGLDASFLYMEDNRTYGHVASLSLFDPRKPDGGRLTIDDAAAQIRDRLGLLPPLRRRLVEVPFNLDHPWWVEDPDFDLEYHIRHIALPPPGDDHQLAEQVARIIARHLDRRRPLWEAYLIEGVAGDRVAWLFKIHHAAIDGVGGAQMLLKMLDLSPDAPPPEVPPWTPERVPTEAEMLALGLRNVLTRPYRLGRLGVRMARAVSRATRTTGPAALAEALASSVPGPLADLAGRVRRDEPDAPGPLPSRAAPRTPLNGRIGPHRRFAFASVPLARVRAVKSALEATVNDVVLAACAAALREWLLRRNALPSEPLVAMCPVSLRSEGDDEGANRVSSIFVPLHTNVADPLERLRRIAADTRVAKERFKLLPADAMVDAIDFAPPVLAARAMRVVAMTRLADRVAPPFNVVISNVPGPQMPLYLAGARMLHYYPVSTIADTQGLNITVQSYDGWLDFGLVSDRELVPDPDVIVSDIVGAVDVLADAAGIDPEPAAAAAPGG